MQWRSLQIVIGLALPFAHALIRFPCSQLVTERSDPLVTPGMVSPHLHQIVGGVSFKLFSRRGKIPYCRRDLEIECVSASLCWLISWSDFRRI
ncbi:hypothetical protein FA15DRAFT_597895 [Coprinopsis marcescibilis]|uniref:Uncharacterized protein n=1 Tax=Coprinopsis marcescibilis TaxID=230819 RepID=A0A5C3KMK6_COPMA|nr:hypothetical protein FA15DRAFT_597895 [Coprinopsis marcescibilis]